MKQIDILWKLQEIENAIENEKKNMKDLASLKTINEKIEDHKKLKNNIISHKERLESCRQGLEDLEIELDDLEVKGEDLKKKLYDGKINDLKQLGLMLKEQEKYEHKNEQINKDIESGIERMDLLQNESEELNKKERDIDKSIRLMLKERKDYIKSSEVALKRLEQEREELLKLISKENLETYKYIKGKKSNPIATLNINICQGCHMDLPVMTLSKMNKNEIVLCNNCGRILYNIEG